MRVVVFAALVVALVVSHADAHGSMIMPLARNSIDAEGTAWANGSHPSTGTIEPYDCGCE